MEAYRVLECTVNSIEGIAACTTLQAPDADIFFSCFLFAFLLHSAAMDIIYFFRTVQSVRRAKTL